MKFFVDTANLKEINEARSLGILDGVTTNPSLISKESVYSQKEIQDHYISICKLMKNEEDVSAEVINTNYTKMIREGEKLSLLHPKIVVKVPITFDGIKAIKYFSNKKIKTNCTLVFSTGQAILAAKVGATYVSPFIGRIDDVSYDGLNLIREIKKIYDNYHFETKILAASIRNPLHIIECSKIGIYAVTTPIKVIYSLLNHPLTNTGLEKFLTDYKNKIK
ncbi:translaldolase [Blattabacterium sp. (Blattella germanica) str. Bge]|uniref:fructose-6-phosphate aldolase n=1 Tax=Blattabacterium sp. (Blattella germanica) TaxID=624186 RepID=UPI0001BB6121|nr:fructose-6-phosphate aldolase [Blattabacterium sp. (Blattella germanica)]ACY40235.1 translaldolase [Blattabacterium sp. (Blattella germanica) str. Bge]